jgi:hypothetical protein
VRKWGPPALAVIVAILAVLVPHPWEGGVVTTITKFHGVHVSDVIVLAALAGFLLIWFHRAGE